VVLGNETRHARCARSHIPEPMLIFARVASTRDPFSWVACVRGVEGTK
jgi:hypothetical protein